jgi:glyoxylase I family protein
MPEIQGIHHVALCVTDLEASTEWYQRVLGATPVMQGMELQPGHTITLLACGQLMIGLHVDEKGESGDRFSEFRVGLDHIGFGCASRTEVEEWAARLDELGVPHSGIQDVPYGHMLVFRDPDNIQLEFFAE